MNKERALHSHCLISVVIPCRNADATLGEALRSISNQACADDIEIVLCDDDSTGHVLDTVKVIDTNCPLRVFRNERNLGPGPSRDLGVSLAHGEWVAFMDADDAMSPERLMHLVQAASGSSADVVFDDLMMCHHTPSGMKAWRRLYGASGFGAHGKRTWVNVEQYLRSPRLLVKPVIRRNFLLAHGLKHGDRRFAEDTEFMLCLYLAGARIMYVPQPMYLYRINPGSLTAISTDRSAMRTCIETCSAWPGWNANALSAFAWKIHALRTNEAMYEIAVAFSQGNLLFALRLALLNPRASLRLLLKSFRRIGYVLHRMVHRGSVRDRP